MVWKCWTGNAGKAATARICCPTVIGAVKGPFEGVRADFEGLGFIGIRIASREPTIVGEVGRVVAYRRVGEPMLPSQEILAVWQRPEIRDVSLTAISGLESLTP